MWKKIIKTLKGWRTAILAFLISVVTVLDLEEVIDALPDDVQTNKWVVVIVTMMFLYLRHITDTPPGWKKITMKKELTND